MKLFRLKRIGEREKEREKKEKKRERKREREREREENFVVEEKIEKSAAKHILKQWNLGWLVLLEIVLFRKDRNVLTRIESNSFPKFT